MIECAGFSKMSLVDWPGKVAAAVFMRQCNFRCPWCHNPDLVQPAGLADHVPVNHILQYLERHRKMLDGLVVTGGEPTLSPDLNSLLSQVKAIGMQVKLDTNGSHPELVRCLLDEHLVDAVAVDYKVPLRLYESLVKGKHPERVAATVDLVLERGCGYVRTTVVPGLHTGELLREMVMAFPGLNKTNYRLQGFRPGNCLDPEYNSLPPVKPDEITRLSKEILGNCLASDKNHTLL